MVNAFADRAFGFGGHGVGQLGAEAFERSLASVGPTVKVNDGTPQDSVKPGNHVFTRRRLLVCAEGFEETILHEVFSQVRVTDAFSRKGDEHPQILQDWFLDMVHTPKMRSGD